MNWLSSNWIWLALGVGALALFGFGRGGCGMGQGGHDHGRQREADQNGAGRKTTVTPLAAAAESTIAPSTDHVHDASSPKEAALVTEHAGHDDAPGEAGSRRHRQGC
ncbi:MAG: hypothetical protein ABIL01_05480 [Pseudomonadota bacterium]